jgi:competence protein ComEA
MFDQFLFKYRFWLGGVLILIIILGVGTIVYDSFCQRNIVKENQAISELKAQNELLRQQLSGMSQQQVAGAATTSTSENQGSKININTASLAELDKIPNIGPARAADIISYRETKGGFKTIEEMKNIKGIGDKTFESMKNMITID